jgi:hypothetical protein
MRKLNTRDAAAYLTEAHGIEIAPRTLDNYAWDGRGPAFFKAVTGRRLYDQATLDAWAIKALGEQRQSTSQTA